MHKTASAVIVVGLMATGFAFFGESETGPPVEEAAPPGIVETAASHEQPAWVLPAQVARERARVARRPLLLVSLNGNLDGPC